jgi:hypothetical protein
VAAFYELPSVALEAHHGFHLQLRPLRIPLLSDRMVFVALHSHTGLAIEKFKGQREQ